MKPKYMREEALLSYFMDTRFVKQIEKDYHGSFHLQDLQLICVGTLNILNGVLMLENDCYHQADIYFSFHVQLVEGQVITSVFYGTNKHDLCFWEADTQMYEKKLMDGHLSLVKTPFYPELGFVEPASWSQYPFSYQLMDGILPERKRKQLLREEKHMQKRMRYGSNRK